MIHATYMSPTAFYVTPAQRSWHANYSDAGGIGIKRTFTWFLFKFKNDMTGRTFYAYPTAITDYGSDRHNYRYSKCEFTQVLTEASEDIYTGKICLKPFGYYYYWIYEAAWIDPASGDGIGTTYPFTHIVATKAPINEMHEYEGTQSTTNYGAIQGSNEGKQAMEEGKLYVQERSHTVSTPNQVHYTEHEEASTTNYIWTN